MPRHAIALPLLVLVAALLADPAQAMTNRAFVASNGSDANTAANCSLALPCRTFQAAAGVVNSGGEVIALNSAGYGPVTLTRSISLTAPNGIYAGIDAPVGDGIIVATSGIDVTLTGITINGASGTGTGGGAIGISMAGSTAGGAWGGFLTVNHCVILNFSLAGIAANGATFVRIVDTLVRNSDIGIELYDGVTADIVGTRVFNSNGVSISVSSELVNNASTTVTITDSVASQSFGGGGVYCNASAQHTTVNCSVIRSTLADSNGPGAQVYATAGNTATLMLSDTLVTGNTEGLLSNGGGGTATLQTLGNNTVKQNNGQDVVGTITTIPAI